MALAGPWHWPTGAPEAVHVTVRAMEAHRTAVAADDPVVARRDLDLGTAEVDAADLPRFRYDGRQPVHEGLGRAELGRPARLGG